MLAREWNRASALAALKAWHEQYGDVPRRTCDEAVRGARALPVAEVRRGYGLHRAIVQHVGTPTEALLLLGIAPRKIALVRHAKARERAGA